MTLTQLIQIIAGGIGSFGFACLFHIRGKRLLVATLGGVLSWFLFVILSYLIPNEPICYFVVSFMISIFAEIMARVMKTPTTTFITTSLVPLIPGGSLYYTMAYGFQGDAARFVTKGLSTLALAAALALGIIIASTLTKLILHKKSK